MMNLFERISNILNVKVDVSLVLLNEYPFLLELVQNVCIRLIIIVIRM